MEFLTAAAILPVKDGVAALARYATLGFAAMLYQGPSSDTRAIYGFLKRDRITLHLALVRS